MSNLKKAGKILLTDIKANKDTSVLAKCVADYNSVLAAAFSRYATFKLSLNYFTMAEMTEEVEDSNELEAYVQIIEEAMKVALLDSNASDDVTEITNKVIEVRDKITSKMKILTAYTDALEIYEYILNRREAFARGIDTEIIDTEALATELFGYVFSDPDKVVINGKIQSIMGQLPVRMTTGRFLDVIGNTISIYTNGLATSAKEFVEMLYDAALINIPEGFEAEYTDLYEIYEALSEADYQNIDEAGYTKLSSLLVDATDKITAEVTNYMMLQEIVNDVLILLFTYDMVKKLRKSDDTADKLCALISEEFKDEKYVNAVTILNGIINPEEGMDMYGMAEQFDNLFISLEGVQEDAFEELSALEANLEYINDEFCGKLNADIDKSIMQLKKADMLTASSLFMNISDDAFDADQDEEICTDEFIAKLKAECEAKFEERLKNLSKLVKRSVMAKVFSILPVFFNSQQEIKDYFESCLAKCTDESELYACAKLLDDIMLD